MVWLKPLTVERRQISNFFYSLPQLNPPLWTGLHGWCFPINHFFPAWHGLGNESSTGDQDWPRKFRIRHELCIYIYICIYIYKSGTNMHKLTNPKWGPWDWRLTSPHLSMQHYAIYWILESLLITHLPPILPPIFIERTIQSTSEHRGPLGTPTSGFSGWFHPLIELPFWIILADGFVALWLGPKGWISMDSALALPVVQNLSNHQFLLVRLKSLGPIFVRNCQQYSQKKPSKQQKRMISP